MEAGRRDIAAIFNKARVLEIPFFQRSYVWRREDWERFADDLLSVGKDNLPYFLGSLILKQRETTATSTIGDIRTVVDGQQRLTSLVLFFRVLCDTVEKPELFESVFHNLENQLTLRHNYNDRQIFEAATSADGPSADLRERYSGNRVLGAFDYFQSRSKEMAQIQPMVLINQLYFVGIDLSTGEDEQQIFDTINSLGVALTTAELLKNLLFDRHQVELYEATWRRAFEEDEDLKSYWSQAVTAGRTRRQNIDLFLQSYLVGNPVWTDDVRVGKLFDDYRRFVAEVGANREELVLDLTEAADLYREHIDPALLDAVPRRAHERLNLVVFGLQTTTVLPAFLQILRSAEGEAEREEMLAVLETYLLRRLIAGSTAKHYNRFFAALARQRPATPEQLIRALTDGDDPSTNVPSDEAVRRGFEETKLTNAQARVVLYLIERSVRNDARHSTALAGFSHYTLEHVMPKKWRNHWGETSPAEADRRDQALRTLGNLTLLSSQLNTSIRDSAWAAKKSGTAERSGLLRYGAGLDIFDPDLDHDEWTVELIGERGRRLAGLAVTEVWPYPDAD
jgi:hypothetical protein